MTTTPELRTRQSDDTNDRRFSAPRPTPGLSKERLDNSKEHITESCTEPCSSIDTRSVSGVVTTAVLGRSTSSVLFTSMVALTKATKSSSFFSDFLAVDIQRDGERAQQQAGTRRYGALRH